MNKEVIKFSYHRDPRNSKRIMTICRRVRTDSTSGYKWVQFGFSICNPADKFSKKIGRDRAVDRMNFVDFITCGDFGLPLRDEDHPKETVLHYLNEFLGFKMTR